MATTQYPNMVPQGNKTQSLGTSAKKWKELFVGDIEAESISGNAFAGGLLDIINALATKSALAAVEGEIENAAAPNYYCEDEPFKADTETNHTTIVTPNVLWLNINNKGHKLLERLSFDISDPLVWDTKATLWQAETEYALGDYVYASSPTATYMYICRTAGTSSSLTPTFPTNVGDTYNDGSVVWECVLNYAAPANRAGKDFYIYAIEDAVGNTPTFTVSVNSTVPVGGTEDSTRKVCGFHCLCLSVGTIAGHKLSGYETGDILPASVWTWAHRPKSEPEGMVYIEGIDMWADIYLASWSGSYSNTPEDLRLETKYGALCADGTSTEKFHCLKFEQVYARQNKRLPYWQEFVALSIGSNQGTNVAGGADVNTTGGFKDTANRRMISDFGCEDCCGNLWQWGADVGSASTGSASYANYYDANDKYVGGQTYGAVYRPIFGGSATGGVVCGSRASNWSIAALFLAWFIGARGLAEPLRRGA